MKIVVVKKSVLTEYGGSNPPLPTIIKDSINDGVFYYIAQNIEPWYNALANEYFKEPLQ